METQIVDVNVDRLVLDWTSYPRNDLCGVTVRRLRDALTAGHALPPIIVCDTTMRVVDGFHRLQAYRLSKRDTIPAEMRHYDNEAGLFRDAVLANIAHGRPLDPYDIRRCVARCLELGICMEEIQEITHLPPAGLSGMIEGFVPCVSGEEVPLKQPLRYLKQQLDGISVSTSQRDGIASYGGRHPTWHARQLISLLTLSLWPKDNVAFGISMDVLCATWKDVRTPATAVLKKTS